VASSPQGAFATIYRDIAARVHAGLGAGLARPAPRIVIEA
jgi:hypothetical protein